MNASSTKGATASSALSSNQAGRGNPAVNSTRQSGAVPTAGRLVRLAALGGFRSYRFITRGNPAVDSARQSGSVPTAGRLVRLAALGGFRSYRFITRGNPLLIRRGSLAPFRPPDGSSGSPYWEGSAPIVSSHGGTPLLIRRGSLAPFRPPDGSPGSPHWEGSAPIVLPGGGAFSEFSVSKL